jgi:hypothetical protein
VDEIEDRKDRIWSGTDGLYIHFCLDVDTGRHVNDRKDVDEAE